MYIKTDTNCFLWIVKCQNLESFCLINSEYSTCETKYKKISYESLKVKTTFIIACRNGVLRSEGVLRSYIQETEVITPIQPIQRPQEPGFILR